MIDGVMLRLLENRDADDREDDDCCLLGEGAAKKCKGW